MTTGAPFADIEAMLTDTTMSMLANVIVTPAAGDPFPAMLDVANTEFFDTISDVDYTLRYVAGPALERGDTLTVSGSLLVGEGVQLTVTEKPAPQHAGHEYVATLVTA